MSDRYRVPGEEVPESEPEVGPEFDGVPDGGSGEESADLAPAIGSRARNILKNQKPRERQADGLALPVRLPPAAGEAAHGGKHPRV